MKQKLSERVSESIYPDLVEQMNLEYYSSFLYRTIASAYDLANLDNVATYFTNASDEEFEHAEGFRHFLLDNDCPVDFFFTGVDDGSLTSNGQAKSTEEILQSVLEHERFVTDSIQAIYKKAKELGTDPETEQFLLAYIEEQIEEEKEAEVQLDLFLMAGNDYDYNRDILTISGDEG